MDGVGAFVFDVAGETFVEPEVVPPTDRHCNEWEILREKNIKQWREKKRGLAEHRLFLWECNETTSNETSPTLVKEESIWIFL